VSSDLSVLLAHVPNTAMHLQTFDGREGREKYPRRWIMLPHFF
jgi:hypothetical protein